jgi:hypothetical protein
VLAPPKKILCVPARCLPPKKVKYKSKTVLTSYGAAPQKKKSMCPSQLRCLPPKKKIDTCLHLSYAILDEHGYASEQDFPKKNISDI